MHLLGDAEAVRAGRLEEAEGEEDEGGADVEQVEPVVVDEEVGRQGLLAPRVVYELVVVESLLQEYGRLLVVHLPLAFEVALVFTSGLEPEVQRSAGVPLIARTTPPPGGRRRRRPRRRVA